MGLEFVFTFPATSGGTEQRLTSRGQDEHKVPVPAPLALVLTGLLGLTSQRWRLARKAR